MEWFLTPFLQPNPNRGSTTMRATSDHSTWTLTKQAAADWLRLCEDAAAVGDDALSAGLYAQASRAAGCWPNPLAVVAAVKLALERDGIQVLARDGTVTSGIGGRELGAADVAPLTADDRKLTFKNDLDLWAPGTRTVLITLKPRVRKTMADAPFWSRPGWRCSAPSTTTTASSFWCARIEALAS
jgi:hypothetical protein